MKECHHTSHAVYINLISWNVLQKYLFGNNKHFRSQPASAWDSSSVAPPDCSPAPQMWEAPCSLGWRWVACAFPPSPATIQYLQNCKHFLTMVGFCMMSHQLPTLFGITWDYIRIIYSEHGTLGWKWCTFMWLTEEWEANKFYLTTLSTAEII